MTEELTIVRGSSVIVHLEFRLLAHIIDELPAVQAGGAVEAVVFDLVRPEDVDDLDAAAGTEVVGDQLAVAAPPEPLGAQHGHTRRFG
jgi:hypothetical protein